MNEHTVSFSSISSFLFFIGGIGTFGMSLTYSGKGKNVFAYIDVNKNTFFIGGIGTFGCRSHILEKGKMYLPI